MISIISFGQTIQYNLLEYPELEIKIEKCYDDWFKSNNVNWSDLKASFENYFTSANKCKSNDSIDKKYMDILNSIAMPRSVFPNFKEKKKVLSIKDKLKLSDQDIKSKKQLDCFITIFLENKSKIDSNSRFYEWGVFLKEIKQIPDISPSIIANAVSLVITNNNLKKEFYQKTIVLMFCFDFALNLPDE
jgi:hypothetical protein